MRVIELGEMAERIEKRKRALGIAPARFEAARNNGSARTPRKRRLLAKIASVARQQGREPAFAANF